MRVLFRDESIPAICTESVRRRLVPAAMSDGASAEPELAELASAGDVRLHACTSSMYVWGVTSQDLVEPMDGGRGLIAFLAEDLAAASQVLTY